MVMAVRMAVPMVMVMAVIIPGMRLGAAIGAAFRLKRRLDMRDRRAEPLKHRLDDMIGPDADDAPADLGGQMPVAEMPGDAGKLRGIPSAHLDQRLRVPPRRAASARPPAASRRRRPSPPPWAGRAGWVRRAPSPASDGGGGARRNRASGCPAAASAGQFDAGECSIARSMMRAYSFISSTLTAFATTCTARPPSRQARRGSSPNSCDSRPFNCTSTWHMTPPRSMTLTFAGMSLRAPCFMGCPISQVDRCPHPALNT